MSSGWIHVFVVPPVRLTCGDHFHRGLNANAFSPPLLRDCALEHRVGRAQSASPAFHTPVNG